MKLLSSSKSIVSTKCAIFFITTLIFGGCASNSGNEKSVSKNLDVAINEQKKSDNLKRSDSLTKKGSSPNIAAQTLFNWQKFFKPSPTLKEKKAIQSQLSFRDDTLQGKALLKRARNQAAIGRFAAAIASYQRLLRSEPDNKKAFLELAQIYLRRKNVDRCFEVLTKVKEMIDAIEGDDDRNFLFQYRYVLALGYLAKKEIAKSRSILSDLMALDRGFIKGYAALASSYIISGKYDTAEFIVKRGLDANRKKLDPSLTNIMAVIYQKRNDSYKARQWLQKTLKINPNYAPALINRARQSISRAEYKAAEKDLRKAIALGKNNETAYILQGILEKKQGRYGAAKNSFRKAIELNPESIYARFNLALLMADSFSEPNQALRLFYEVIQSREEDEKIKETARLHIQSIRENRL